jgi:hypothetical protein
MQALLSNAESDLVKVSEELGVALANSWHYESEAMALKKLVVNSDAWKAPCPICNYTGPGWYQPSTHPCAALRENDVKKGGTK